MASVTVLPLDESALPEMADEINNKLVAVRLAGAAEATMAAVSMETAQMQSECTEPTDGCYLRVARLLDADRMLWAQVERVPSKAPKRRKAKPITKIQMFLFDRDRLGLTGQAEEEFAGPITTSDIDRLIAATIGSQAASPALSPAGVAPAPAGVAPAPAGAAPAPTGVAPAPTYPAQPAASPAPNPMYAPRAPVSGAATPPASQPGSAGPPPAAAPAPTYPGPAASPPPAAAPAYPGPAAAPPPASPPPASFPPASAPAAPPRMQ